MSAGSSGGYKPFVAATDTVARHVIGLVQGPYRSRRIYLGGSALWCRSTRTKLSLRILVIALGFDPGELGSIPRGIANID